jgi:hypothetical protein
MERAPIWVTVFDRPKHFRLCIESLAKNQQARDTILYISSDGPKDAVSAASVAEVREYIKSITGFKKIIPFTPKINTNSEIKKTVYDELRTNHTRYIITEDDNVFSPFSLDFFNDALDVYEKNEKIIAVSGYMYPGFPGKRSEQIFLKFVATWGVALWRDKDLALKVNEKMIAKEVFADKDLFKKVNQLIPHTPPMIKAVTEGRIEANDLIRSVLAIKYDQYSVFPSFSLVRNIGNDGTGEHCGVNDIYDNQEISSNKIILDVHKPIESSKLDEEWLSNFFGGKSARIYGLLIFWNFNANHIFSRIFIFSLVKTYEIVQELIARWRKFWR